jgi:hypothetical protein
MINLRNIDLAIVLAAKCVARRRAAYDHVWQLSQEVRQEASLELSQARQRLDSVLTLVAPDLRAQPDKRKELIELLEYLSLKESGSYAHPAFYSPGDDTHFKRLPPGAVIPEWQTVVLRKEAQIYSPNSTQTIEEFTFTEPFTVPETTNGCYYAIEVWNNG